MAGPAGGQLGPSLAEAGEPVPPAELAASPLIVAPRLLGCLLVHETAEGTVAVRLTEVEAYDGGADPGSHAFRGRTPRTEVMFGPPGRLYVYFSYGMHWCVNVVCREAGSAAAVLLRAGEVVSGQPLARSRRSAARRDVDLARGPANLASALGLDGAHNGQILGTGGVSLWRPDRGAARLEVVTGPRVGVSGAGGDGTAFPWRFSLRGEATVSAYRAAARPRRRPERGR